jgi:hypothetical protein
MLYQTQHHAILQGFRLADALKGIPQHRTHHLQQSFGPAEKIGRSP